MLIIQQEFWYAECPKVLRYLGGLFLSVDQLPRQTFSRTARRYPHTGSEECSLHILFSQFQVTILSWSHATLISTILYYHPYSKVVADLRNHEFFLKVVPKRFLGYFRRPVVAPPATHCWRQGCRCPFFSQPFSLSLLQTYRSSAAVGPRALDGWIRMSFVKLQWIRGWTRGDNFFPG